MAISAINATAILALADAQQSLDALYKHEPLLATLLEIAALQPAGGRWHSLESIKHLAYPLVGVEARCAALRTADARITFLSAVDALLPKEVR